MNWYGSLLALAIWAGALLVVRVAAADGVPPRTIWRILATAVAGSYVGGKLMLLLVRPDAWRPTMPEFWLAAGHYCGGLAVGVALIVPQLIRARRHAPAIANALALGLCLGQTIGRFACFRAGCCFGRPTSLPWAVQYRPEQHANTGVPVGVGMHPVQMYEALFTGVLLLTLLSIRKARRGPWRVCATYCVAYGAARCWFETLRGDERGELPIVGNAFGLNPAQLGALLLATMPLLVVLLRRRRSARLATNGAGAS